MSSGTSGNPNIASGLTRFKVGVFSVAGLLLIGAVTVFVNDKPYWWRKCDLVQIYFEDATGLKTKSPVRSLGLEIGYLSGVELYGEKVRLDICVTAPVEVLASTRAYIKGEGFLGDKFVELKPVRYIGSGPPRIEPSNTQTGTPEIKPESSAKPTGQVNLRRLIYFFDSLVPNAEAAEAEAAKPKAGREIPAGDAGKDLQHVVNQVDGLVGQLTELTTNLKDAIDPKELRNTMQQLNKTLENASRTLSPEGGLNTTAQRTLSKLEEAIENLRDMMARINRGQGSVGMLINDPTYAEEIREAIRNVNKLLGKVGEIRFVVDLGGEQINGYAGGRGWFRLAIWPSSDRYYLLGASLDPRGKRTTKTLTTTSGGVSTTVKTTEIEDGGLLLNVMLGKIFWNRIEGALGLLHGDGAITLGLRMGPNGREDFAVLKSDLYSRGKGYTLDDRLTMLVKPWGLSSILNTVYVSGGLESIRKIDNKIGWTVGAGLQFDDHDIKLLFAFK